MKKHIIGLTLFSLIVSAAAIAYSFFYIEKIPIQTTRYSSGETIACDAPELREKESGEAKIRQAVYNVKTNTLSWKLAGFNAKKSAALHWFIENNNGMKKVLSLYIQDSTGEIEISPQSELGKMLTNFPKSNQYLMVDIDRKYMISNALKEPFAFDASKAFPLTIDYGK